MVNNLYEYDLDNFSLITIILSLNNLSATSFLSERSAVVQSEHVVVAVVTEVAAHSEVEALGELHGLGDVAVDDEVTGDEAENSIVETWLRVKSQDIVTHRGQCKQLVHDCLRAQELFTLVGEHGLALVESAKVSAVGVEGVVVVIYKLLAHLVK